jgi:hypothetical protein
LECAALAEAVGVVTEGLEVVLPSDAPKLLADFFVGVKGCLLVDITAVEMVGDGVL